MLEGGLSLFSSTSYAPKFTQGLSPKQRPSFDENQITKKMMCVLTELCIPNFQQTK